MHIKTVWILIFKKKCHITARNRTPHLPCKLFLHRILHWGGGGGGVGEEADLQYVLPNDKQNILCSGKL